MKVFQSDAVTSAAQTTDPTDEIPTSNSNQAWVIFFLTLSSLLGWKCRLTSTLSLGSYYPFDSPSLLTSAFSRMAAAKKEDDRNSRKAIIYSDEMDSTIDLLDHPTLWYLLARESIPRPVQGMKTEKIRLPSQCVCGKILHRAIQDVSLRKLPRLSTNKTHCVRTESLGEIETMVCAVQSELGEHRSPNKRRHSQNAGCEDSSMKLSINALHCIDPCTTQDLDFNEHQTYLFFFHSLTSLYQVDKNVKQSDFATLSLSPTVGYFSSRIAAYILDQYLQNECTVKVTEQGTDGYKGNTLQWIQTLPSLILSFLNENTLHSLLESSSTAESHDILPIDKIESTSKLSRLVSKALHDVNATQAVSCCSCTPIYYNSALKGSQASKSLLDDEILATLQSAVKNCPVCGKLPIHHLFSTIFHLEKSIENTKLGDIGVKTCLFHLRRQYLSLGVSMSLRREDIGSILDVRNGVHSIVCFPEKVKRKLIMQPNAQSFIDLLQKTCQGYLSSIESTTAVPSVFALESDSDFPQGNTTREVSSHSAKDLQPPLVQWTCNLCTFINSPENSVYDDTSQLICEICGSPLEVSEPSTKRRRAEVSKEKSTPKTPTNRYETFTSPLWVEILCAFPPNSPDIDPNPFWLCIDVTTGACFQKRLPAEHTLLNQPPLDGILTDHGQVSIPSQSSRHKNKKRSDVQKPLQYTVSMLLNSDSKGLLKNAQHADLSPTINSVDGIIHLEHLYPEQTALRLSKNLANLLPLSFRFGVADAMVPKPKYLCDVQDNFFKALYETSGKSDSPQAISRNMARFPQSSPSSYSALHTVLQMIATQLQADWTGGPAEEVQRDTNNSISTNTPLNHGVLQNNSLLSLSEFPSAPTTLEDLMKSKFYTTERFLKRREVLYPHNESLAVGAIIIFSQGKEKGSQNSLNQDQEHTKSSSNAGLYQLIDPSEKKSTTENTSSMSTIGVMDHSKTLNNNTSVSMSHQEDYAEFYDSSSLESIFSELREADEKNRTESEQLLQESRGLNNSRSWTRRNENVRKTCYFVYPKSMVHKLNTVDQWMSLHRRIIPGQTPYRIERKTIKSGIKSGIRNFDSASLHSNSQTNFQLGSLFLDESSSQADTEVSHRVVETPLFGIWQTLSEESWLNEDIKLRIQQAGSKPGFTTNDDFHHIPIPVTSKGWVDIFASKDPPVGCTYLPHEFAYEAAQALGVPKAQALVRYSYSRGGIATPELFGAVVRVEHRTIVAETANAMHQSKLLQIQQQQERNTLKCWRKLILSILRMKSIEKSAKYWEKLQDTTPQDFHQDCPLPMNQSIEKMLDIGSDDDEDIDEFS